MNHASLFSGIGGFDLAADWIGWNNIFHCEINPFCQRILNYYWPNAKTYTDIKQTDFTIWRGRIDILTGGFPCQPYSAAGKRLGKEDERHLWPEMLRAIREIKPRYIVGENVGGLLTWNGGLVFEEVCADLENEGYEVQAFIIPACAKDAPHRRDRVWIIAHANGERLQRWVHPNRQKCKVSTFKTRQLNALLSRNSWQNFPTQSPICGGDDGLPTGLDGITFPKWRNESIKGYGNAIVPQVVYEIFKAIENK
jgi:DNA (cytosine-5)-methyltransferase 1